MLWQAQLPPEGFGNMQHTASNGLPEGVDWLQLAQYTAEPQHLKPEADASRPAPSFSMHAEVRAAIQGNVLVRTHSCLTCVQLLKLGRMAASGTECVADKRAASEIGVEPCSIC